MNGFAALNNYVKHLVSTRVDGSNKPADDPDLMSTINDVRRGFKDTLVMRIGRATRSPHDPDHDGTSIRPPPTAGSGGHPNPARHNFHQAMSSNRERSCDLDRWATVQWSKYHQRMLRFLMMVQWTCHDPKMARKRRSAGHCPPRTWQATRLVDGPAPL